MAKTSLTAAAQVAAVNVRGFKNDGLAFIISGTFVGTLSFEATDDDSGSGSEVFLAVKARPLSTIGNDTLTATAGGIFVVPNVGMAIIRVRMSAYTSGTAVVNTRVIPASQIVF